jgi:RNA polymerase sigma-70 factor (ECF subfamily)
VRRSGRGSSQGAELAQAADEEFAVALVAARHGDEAGFVRLYRTLQPLTLRYAGAIVGADAEDVAAEAWLQVARDLGSFDGDPDAFRGWLSTVVRHRALDHLRAQARRPVVLDDLLALAERPGPDDTAATAVERLDTARAIALVARLPREQAEAVLLRAVLGLDVAQAAAVLGKRPVAVRVAAHRGLRRLAALLAGARDPAEQGPRNALARATAEEVS